MDLREQVARTIAETLDGETAWGEPAELDYVVADAILARYEVRQHAHPTDVT